MFIGLPLLTVIHRALFTMRDTKWGSMMAHDFPFPRSHFFCSKKLVVLHCFDAKNRWEIYYLIIIFPGLVTSSAQILMMEQLRCKVAGIAGLTLTALAMLGVLLWLIVRVRPASERRRVIFDNKRLGWLVAPPRRNQITSIDNEDHSDEILTELVVRMSDWKIRDAMDALVTQLHAHREKASELLQHLDRNGDGWLSRDELKTGLNDMGIRLGGFELDMAMKAFDADGDGHIDVNEFKHALSQYDAVLEMRKLEAALKSHAKQANVANSQWGGRMGVIAPRRASAMWASQVAPLNALAKDHCHSILSGLVMRTVNEDVSKATDRLIAELESRHEPAADGGMSVGAASVGGEAASGATDSSTQAGQESRQAPYGWHSVQRLPHGRVGSA